MERAHRLQLRTRKYKRNFCEVNGDGLLSLHGINTSCNEDK